MTRPFVFDETGEAKRFAPATVRNRDAIGDVLETILPPSGNILEIASGTGEHLVHFAARFPALLWQPSDYDEVGLASIAAWSAEAGFPNILPPIQIDAGAPYWPVTAADAILCINMIHIAPWSATLGLLAGAAQILPRGAPLFLYGPYRQHGVPTATSNEAFDVSLQSRNPEWGLRHIEDVAAAASGFALDRIVEMAANNLSVIFRKT